MPAAEEQIRQMISQTFGIHGLRYAYGNGIQSLFRKTVDIVQKDGKTYVNIFGLLLFFMLKIDSIILKKAQTSKKRTGKGKKN